MRPPIPNVCMSLASAGLMFGATAAAATGNRNSEAQDHLDVWTTRLSGNKKCLMVMSLTGLRLTICLFDF